MKPIHTIHSTAVILRDSDIDTDQIIPARYLVTTSRNGMAEGCLRSRRFKSDGTMNPDSPLNHEMANSAEILIAGPNFGCGSSREHAAWALLDYGFSVVIAPSFADIFSSNAAKNGLLTAKIDQVAWQQLQFQNFPDLSVDLETQQILHHSSREQHRFEIDAFARKCLLAGMDPLGYLLDHLREIEEHEERYEARLK